MPVVNRRWNHEQWNHKQWSRCLKRQAYIMRNDTNKIRKRYQNIGVRDTDVFLMCS